MMVRPLPLLLLGVLGSLGACDLVAQTTQHVPPPRPLMPIPTARQMDWQRDELRMFLHFTVNTFTDMEWGTGREDPDIFNPANLDARQWARVARETGFKTLVLTAKHHDGFTLWPSAFTDHSVESSPWKDGEGDVVGEVAAAARAEGLKLGLYLSPWDMHEPSYGDEEGYNRFYMGQLQELLTRYGPLAEVWFDGAKGEGAADMSYAFEEYRAMVRQLQPNAVMFSDEGPDVRWIGNERGFAGETNWSTLDLVKVEIGKPGQGAYLNQGEAGGPAWIPGECDVSIRPGWFWHPDQQPKSLDALLEIYFNSVGRNCLLLLNVPPNPDGRISEEDVARLTELSMAIDAVFDEDLAVEAEAQAESVWGNDHARYGGARALDGDLGTYWAPRESELAGTLTLDLPEATAFDVVRLQEPVTLGQRVARYRVDAWVDGEWSPVATGTTIGYKKLDRLEKPVTTTRVRLVVEESRAEPLIAEMGLYLQPSRFPSGATGKTGTGEPGLQPAAPSPATQESPSADSLFHLLRPSMGTTAEVFLYAADGQRAAELFEAAFEEIDRVESALSTYRPTSEASRINREAGEGPVTTDPETFDLLQRAFAFSERTGGAFDITAGPLVRAWGFFGDEGRFPSPEELSEARNRSGWEKVSLNEARREIRFLTPGVELDLGAIGKGWALDRAAERLRALGVEAALVVLGQNNYYAVGAPPGTRGWPIHVPDPRSPGEPLSTVHLRDRSLSTSGSSERYFERAGTRYSHIIDPRTGRPARGLTQVTVTAPSAADSDALSTALFVLGADEGPAVVEMDESVSALLVTGPETNGRVLSVRWTGSAGGIHSGSSPPLPLGKN